MPGCCAPNCSRHSRNGVRLFVFPKDVKRREIWLQMCRRDEWIPSNHSKLCEFHFEESQFEKHREDKWKKLKPNAIPTIFDVPNKPKLITLKRKNRSNHRVKSPLKENISPGGDEGSTAEGSVMMDCDTVTELLPQLGESSKGVTEINKLENKIKLLNRQLWRTQKEVLSLKKKNRILTEKIEKLPFLNEHLMSILSSGHKRVLKWPPEILKQAVQIRFAVGWKGYKYLRKELGYPLPSYSTLCRHLQKMEYNPGLLNNLLPYLASKRETQEIHETDCILLIDEMELQKALEYDKSSGAFFGYVTSPRESNKEAELGSQLLVFMLRGLNTNWKQVVGWHITSKSSDTNEMFSVINNIIHEIENIGYKIWGITSDMCPKNQAVWKKFGVRVGRYSDMPSIQHPIRKENVLYFFADVPHLLKNLRSAFMSHTIILPAHIVQAENLPSNTIDFKYLLKIHTIQEKKDLKLAPKITKNVLEPSNFEKRNVSYAAHIFSVQTAAAIETLVKLELISSKAMTTAWFIRKVRSWFDALNGRVLKQAFTKKIKNTSLKILIHFST